MGSLSAALAAALAAAAVFFLYVGCRLLHACLQTAELVRNVKSHVPLAVTVVTGEPYSFVRLSITVGAVRREEISGIHTDIQGVVFQEGTTGTDSVIISVLTASALQVKPRRIESPYALRRTLHGNL